MENKVVKLIAVGYLCSMEKKTCNICNLEKNIDQFYKHKKQPDGYIKQCKDCVKQKEQEKKSNPEYIEKQRARGREKYHRLYKGVSFKKGKSYHKTYQEKYPEKRKADIAMNRISPSIKGNHLHHWSYNEEHYKDVIELTIQQHNKLHRYMIYDQERMMYRTQNGVLLDTKESHIEYAEYVFSAMEDYVYELQPKLEDEVRKCVWCGLISIQNEFYKYKGGYTGLCKECQAKKSKGHKSPNRK